MFAAEQLYGGRGIHAPCSPDQVPLGNFCECTHCETGKKITSSPAKRFCVVNKSQRTAIHFQQNVPKREGTKPISTTILRELQQLVTLGCQNVNNVAVICIHRMYKTFETAVCEKLVCIEFGTEYTFCIDTRCIPNKLSTKINIDISKKFALIL